MGSYSLENIQYRRDDTIRHHATPSEKNDPKRVTLMDTKTKVKTAPLQQAVSGGNLLN